MQHELIAALRAAYPDTPTVLFLLNGGMLDITPEKSSVPAILECFYPGFWGGVAIADTLFGDNAHLGGRYIPPLRMTPPLPSSWGVIHSGIRSDPALPPLGCRSQVTQRSPHIPPNPPPHHE